MSPRHELTVFPRRFWSVDCSLLVLWHIINLLYFESKRTALTSLRWRPV